MKENIPFKKEIIFKTTIGSITDISINHDYHLKDDMVEGVFYVGGKYKMTEASVIEEEFFYNIPFSIAISDRIEKSSLELVLDNFDYKIKNDVLSLAISLIMNFEEIKTEEEKVRKEEIFDELEKEIEEKNESINIIEEEKITEKDTNNIADFSKNNMETNFTTYKIIKFDNDTIENITNKYNVTLDDLKLVNDIENINFGDKIIIPIINNE